MEEKTGKPAVKERPMLFSAPMVRALLEGSKTQTRRVAKFKPRDAGCNLSFSAMRVGHYMTGKPEAGFVLHAGAGDSTFPLICPYGQPGDRIWVRETFQGPLFDGERMDEFRRDSSKFEKPEFCVFAADGGGPPEFQDADDNLFCRWRPSIHMPRWASRIQLEIVAVRVERLQAISYDDAVAEGIDHEYPKAVAQYHALWEQINGAGSWSANPWVWVVEFKRVTP